jgi:hypothetical protein
MRAAIVVNVQGDLPTLLPADIAAAIGPLADPAVEIATLAAEISRVEERSDPNVVKLVGTPVAERRLRALYFTRATAPPARPALSSSGRRFAAPRARFVALPSPLGSELEQLRALEGNAHRRCRGRAARGRHPEGLGGRAQYSLPPVDLRPRRGRNGHDRQEDRIQGEPGELHLPRAGSIRYEPVPCRQLRGRPSPRSARAMPRSARSIELGSRS